LSQFLNGRNKRLSDDMTGKLHAAFPDLNVLWLLFGEGDMVASPNFKISEAKITPENDESLPEGSICKEFESPAPYIAQPKDLPANGANREYNSIGGGEKASSASSAPSIPLPHLSTDPAKKIQSIMVFYSDSSYEIFTPAD